MQCPTELKLTAVELQAVDQLLRSHATDQSDPLASALRKIFTWEQLNADEQMRNEALGQSRTWMTAQFAARARVFAEMWNVFRNRLERQI